MDDAQVTRFGFLDMQVCVPKNWDDDQVVKFAEKEYPCGTTNGWTIRRQGHYEVEGQQERTQCLGKGRDEYCHIHAGCVAQKTGEGGIFFMATIETYRRDLQQERRRLAQLRSIMDDATGNKRIKYSARVAFSESVIDFIERRMREVSDAQ